MQYQLNPDSPWSLNGSLTDNGDGTSAQPIIINPMIVGDTYGFVSSSPSKNSTVVNVPNKGLDIDQLKAYINPLAEKYCKEQYPDTK